MPWLSAQANTAINYFSMRISEQRIRVFQEVRHGSLHALGRDRAEPARCWHGRRVDLAQAQTQLEQTRAQLVAENINRATFEHAVAVLAGKAPADLSVEPGRRRRTMPTIDARRSPRRSWSGGPTSPRPSA